MARTKTHTSDLRLRDYWHARMDEHRALGHEPHVGWHFCEQEPCIFRQAEFDSTRFKDERSGPR